MSLEEKCNEKIVAPKLDKDILDVDKYSQNLLRFMWPKYQILAKFRPKEVSRSENETLYFFET